MIELLLLALMTLLIGVLMVATVEIDESNESAGEQITHNITNSNYGNSDTVNLVPATYPIPRPDESFQKWHRVDVTAMGGSNKIDNLRFWRSSGTLDTGVDHLTNAHTVQGTYDTQKKTAYEAPAKDISECPTAVPTSKPGSANLGIAGSLTGSLVATGQSDYLLHCVDTDGTTPQGDHAQLTNDYVYDEQ
jgi:hypothetical protein